MTTSELIQVLELYPGHEVYIEDSEGIARAYVIGPDCFDEAEGPALLLAAAVGD